MMELLAGPNIVAQVDGIYTTPSGANRAFWDDEIGLGSLATYATSGDSFGYGPNYFITQLDGVCGARAKSLTGSILLDTSGEYEWCLYYAGFDSALGESIGSLYGFDKQSGTYADKLIYSGAGLLSDPGGAPQIRAIDRIISIQGSVVKKRAIDGSDPAWVTECTLTPGTLAALVSTPTVSRTKDPEIVCLIYKNGNVIYYDVNEQKQVIKPWFAIIGANSGAWYSVKFDIFISYTISGSDWYVSVWANSVRPATLDNPEPLTSVASGRVTQFRVRLLGDHDEPCEGELISWSITDGGGSLTAAQSKTDAEGYAYIGYVAPINGGSTATIQAIAEF